MWCTRWYLPLLLLPFPTTQPFFLLVLIFSLTLHARPCLYCIVLLVALFTSSCYWAPKPLDIPSHTLENALPNLLYGPSISLQSLLDAPPEPLNETNSSSRITYSARLERPKRCWCAPQNLFEPFNLTQWEARSRVSVFGRRDFWGWLMDEQIPLPPPPEKNQTEGASNATEPDLGAGTGTTEIESVSASATGSASWQSRWATFQERVASYGRPKESLSETASLEPTKTEALPLPVRTPDLNAATTTLEAPTATSDPTPLPWIRKEYDLRPYGGGVILDFGWGRPKEPVLPRQERILKPHSTPK